MTDVSGLPALSSRDILQVLLYGFGKWVWPGLSPEGQGQVAVLLSRASWIVQRRKRDQAVANLSIAFGAEATPEWRRKIITESLSTFWWETLDLFDTPRQAAKVDRMTCTGLLHLRTALSHGKGVVLYGSSLGRRTVAQRYLTREGFALHHVHTEFHVSGLYTGPQSATRFTKNWLKPRYESLERRFVPQILYLPTTGSFAFARTLAGLLERNTIVWSRGDAFWGQKMILMPFLGQHFPFPTGMLSLARMTGAPILPAFCYRLPDGGLCLTIEAPLPLAASDREAALHDGLAYYVALVESYTRRYPGQYRDWHYVNQARQHHLARTEGGGIAGGPPARGHDTETADD